MRPSATPKYYWEGTVGASPNRCWIAIMPLEITPQSESILKRFHQRILKSIQRLFYGQIRLTSDQYDLETEMILALLRQYPPNYRVTLGLLGDRGQKPVFFDVILYFPFDGLRRIQFVGLLGRFLIRLLKSYHGQHLLSRSEDTYQFYLLAIVAAVRGFVD